MIWVPLPPLVLTCPLCFLACRATTKALNSCLLRADFWTVPKVPGVFHSYAFFPVSSGTQFLRCHLVLFTWCVQSISTAFSWWWCLCFLGWATTGNKCKTTNRKISDEAIVKRLVAHLTMYSAVVISVLSVFFRDMRTSHRLIQTGQCLLEVGVFLCHNTYK